MKDNFGLGVFLLLYAGFVFFAPNFFGEPDNYIPANPLVTPAHIVPEWYFLPYYAILRAVDDNFIGSWILFGYTLSIFFHMANGIRHLVWDAGYGYRIDIAHQSGRIVVAAAVVLTILVWIARFVF